MDPFELTSPKDVSSGVRYGSEYKFERRPNATQFINSIDSAWCLDPAFICFDKWTIRTLVPSSACIHLASSSMKISTKM